MPIVPTQQSDYIDELDLELLRRRQKLENVAFKQPIPKWMNIAWDAFRILDNHSKSMIFMMPDDTNSEEYQLYLKRVQKPISLETIRNKLNLKYYQNFEEFVDDMNTLFENFVKFRGKEHKLYKYCESVQQRFAKFVEKGKLRTASSHGSAE
ncbi:hypothetical protein FGO68_gene9490 [Halteria grandinella]|uniref:Bromo domain-containing protein n=1 Tax=Halteria grandinella TaxID=5974 RepID=A0A8J8T0Z0_HALGN|nr:hypothetical protein FGO68_gene9490 [Halteria grandinella]